MCQNTRTASREGSGRTNHILDSFECSRSAGVKSVMRDLILVPVLVLVIIEGVRDKHATNGPFTLHKFREQSVDVAHFRIVSNHI
jgi:hypothetical protein